jgi:hypothetical protein
MSSRLRFVFGLTLVAAVLCLAPLPHARACGMFVPSLKVKAPPRMEQERTLIVWDASTRRQQFVREVRFANTGELPFGFIVTTPSRPEVNDVKSAPFDALETSFPHTLLDTPDEHARAPGSKGGDEGFGRGAPAGAGPPVQVLEKKRVGDFTSFVLAATDGKALGDWLKKNQFRASEAGQRWIDRYVKLGFFFVALRYEGKKQKAADGEGLVSRTVRLSFDTALPYYPYHEPDDAPEQRGRELQVWLVTQGLHQPLAPHVSGGEVSIHRAWSEGTRYDASPSEIASAFGTELASLVPSGARVMTFGDWKEHRHGFGDLVLAPATPEGCDAACVNARRPLMALLDPTAGASTADAAQLVVPPPVPRAPTTRAIPQNQPPAIATGSPLGNALSCSLGKATGSPALVLAAVIALGLFRRRRVLLVAALAGLGACGTQPPPPPPTPPPSSAVATTSATAAVAVAEPGPGLVSPGKLDAHVLPAERPARDKALMRLLAGHSDDKLIPVWSTPMQRGIGHARNAASNAVRAPEAIERHCAEDSRVEGTVTYVVDSDESGATRAKVEGPLPGPVLACIESHLAGAGPRIGRGAEAGRLSLGVISPETMNLRRRIKESKLVAASSLPRSGLIGVKRISSTASAGLPREVVERVLRAQFARFGRCYERDQHPAPRGQVTLKFDIGPGGRVTTMAASAGDVAGTTALCIGDAVRGLSFPSPEGGRTVKVTQTLGFERGK